MKLNRALETSLRKALSRFFNMLPNGRIVAADPTVYTSITQPLEVLDINLESADQAYTWITSAASEFEVGVRLQICLNTAKHQLSEKDKNTHYALVFNIAESKMPVAMHNGYTSVGGNLAIYTPYLRDNSLTSQLEYAKNLGFAVKAENLFGMGSVNKRTHYILSVVCLDVEVSDSKNMGAVAQKAKELFRQKVNTEKGKRTHTQLYYNKPNEFIVGVVYSQAQDTWYTLEYNTVSKQGFSQKLGGFSTGLNVLSVQELRANLEKQIYEQWLELQIQEVLFSNQGMTAS